MSMSANARSMLPYFVLIAAVIVIGVMLLRRSGVISETVILHSGSAVAQGDGRSVELVTLLPKDGISAIFKPKFIAASEAATQLRDDDLVIGVSINGEHRAYGVAYLSGHEVVNDTVGGRPIAVTW